MNNYFFKQEKVIELLSKIQKDLKEKKKVLNKAFEIDYKEWEIKVEIEKLLNVVENIKEQKAHKLPCKHIKSYHTRAVFQHQQKRYKG